MRGPHLDRRGSKRNELTYSAVAAISSVQKIGNELTFGISADQPLLNGGLYLAALGLLALGLATIIRHTAAAISGFVGVLFILPTIADVLPSSYVDDIGRFLPQNIGTVMLSAHYHGSDPFGPWTGFVLPRGYAVAVLIAGGVFLVRRDA